MRLFDWFSKKSRPLHPEALWTVVFDDECVRVTDHKGAVKVISAPDLSGVAIETNDSGPWGADVWWLLFGSRGQVACAFPQGATGESEATDFLMALPGFDNEEFVKAMGSTSNAVFPVWRRSN